MLILDCVQGEAEWKTAKVGIPSASNYERIVDSKGNPSKQREKYLIELAEEIIRGKITETYQSPDMLKGTVTESDAADLYEQIKQVEVEKIGFCFRDESKKYGCSPDRFVGENGGLEIKSAKFSVQYERLTKGWSRAEHFQQVQGCLLVTGRDWWDLMSYNDILPSIIIRFERDKEFLKKLSDELDKFCVDLAITVKKIREL